VIIQVASRIGHQAEEAAQEQSLPEGMTELIDEEISPDDRYLLQERYLDLTRVALPAEARRHGWTLRHDHCFMRIILDHLFSDCWYNHLDRRLTAYKQLNVAQLQQAIELAENLLRAGEQLVKAMNARSLRWRAKS
jgi:hypothetical protein